MKYGSDSHANSTVLGVCLPHLPRLQRTKNYLAKHRKKAIAAIVATPLFGIARLFEGDAEKWMHDEILHHASSLAQIGLHSLLFILRYPFLLPLAALAGIVVHAYCVSNRARANLACISWGLTTVVFESDRYRRKAMVSNPSGTMWAVLLHLANEYSDVTPTISAGFVKAQVTHQIEGGRYPASPGTWIDEPCNSVEFRVGDTRYLILTLGLDFREQWVTLANRRNSPSDPIGFDYITELWYDIEGTIDVQLIGRDSGELVRSFLVKWKWKHPYRPTIISVEAS